MISLVKGKVLRPDLDGEVPRYGVQAHRMWSRGIAEWMVMGPSLVANSLSCSKESLDEGEGVDGWELS
jgi:hypothetical protein